MTRELFEADVEWTKSIASKAALEAQFRRQIRLGILFAWAGIAFGLLLIAVAVIYTFMRAGRAGGAIWIVTFISLPVITFFIRALTLQTPESLGLRVERKDAPTFWDVVDEACNRFGVTRPKRIVLTHEREVNVVAGRRPRPTLEIGLPKLMALSVGELQAAIADELLLYSKHDVWCFRMSSMAATLHTQYRNHVASKKNRDKIDRFERYRSRLEALRVVLTFRRALAGDHAHSTIDRDAVVDALARPRADHFPEWEAIGESVSGPMSSWSKYREMVRFLRSRSPEEVRAAVEARMQVPQMASDPRPSLEARLDALEATDSNAIAERLSAPQSWALDQVFDGNPERWLQEMDRQLEEYLGAVEGHHQLKSNQALLDDLPQSEWRKAHYFLAIQLQLDLGQIEIARDTLQEARAKFPVSRDLIWLEACLAAKDNAPDVMDRLDEVIRNDFVRKPIATGLKASLLRDQARIEEAYEIEWRWEEESERYENHFVAMLLINDGRYSQHIRVIEPDSDALQAAAEIRHAMPNIEGIHFLQRIDPGGLFEPKFILVVPKRKWYRLPLPQWEEVSTELQKFGALAIEWNVAALQYGTGLAARIKKEAFQSQA